MPATKDEIAATFMELVCRHGLRRTAVEDVARALHVSKKTIYQHFGSKNDLLRYGIELWAKRQRPRVESLLTDATALGRIQQAVGVALADARSFYGSESRVDMDVAPEITAQVNDKVFAPMLCDLLVEGVTAGEFDVVDCEATALFIVAMGTEAVRMLEADSEGCAEEYLMDAIRRLLHAADATNERCERDGHDDEA